MIRSHLEIVVPQKKVRIVGLIDFYTIVTKMACRFNQSLSVLFCSTAIIDSFIYYSKLSMQLKLPIQLFIFRLLVLKQIYQRRPIINITIFNKKTLKGYCRYFFRNNPFSNEKVFLFLYACALSKI